MRSMTAFGRALSRDFKGLQWSVELAGVNRKMLDIHVLMPKEWLHFEIPVRQHLAAEIERGQITVRINLKSQSNLFQKASLKTLQATWVEIAEELGYAKSAIDLPFLMNRLSELPPESSTSTSPELEQLLKETLAEALNAFIDMKNREGKALKEDLEKRVDLIGSALEKIEAASEGAPQKYFLKLKERISQISEIEDERLLREVALYAEKADITEEITRLRSHLSQAKHNFNSQEKSVGRTLDFLTQEMQREIGTILSKASTLDISNLALYAKAELEKIREQVQNIE